MVKCPNCGSENLDYSYYCSRCSRELPRGDAGRSEPPVQAPPAASWSRFCPSCGRSIQFDANVCPYCGHDFRWSASPRRSEPISDTMRIVLYLVSALLAPIAGIIIGIIFIMKPEPDYKHVGKMCLIISLVVGVLIPVIVMILFFGAIMTM